jgi:predicted DNA binding CopG/RHH family protein
VKKTRKKASASPKLGRPPLEPVLVRDKRLDVRFSAAEIEALKSRAASAGSRWSDWVRGRLGDAGG